jgi:ATP-dependent DNA ligase
LAQCRHRIDRGDIRAFTRGGHDWTDKYGRVIVAGRKLKCRSAVLDGEVIVQDRNGLSDFAALRAAIEGARHRLVMFAFDLLFLDGRDLRRLPVIERRERLQSLLPEDQRFPIQFSEHWDGSGAALFHESLCHGPGGHRLQAGAERLQERPFQVLARNQECGGE